MIALTASMGSSINLKPSFLLLVTFFPRSCTSACNPRARFRSQVPCTILLEEFKLNIKTFVKKAETFFLKEAMNFLHVE